jgi:hypothetical protein
MENKRYKVRLNSNEKIEELLQEVYDLACRQINEIQNEISKLINSTNLGADDFTMDDKAKYFKAMHDLNQDKKMQYKPNWTLLNLWVKLLSVEVM